MTAKKKYYTTKNEMITNLQNELANQQKAHEKEIKELQDTTLKAEQDRAYWANLFKKWSNMRFRADDAWDLCNMLSVNDLSTILHCFKDKITFYYDDGEVTEIITLDTEADPFYLESGSIEISLVAEGDDDE